MNPSFDHVIVLADESADWKIAGLCQLDRLVLALDELATSISSQRKIDIFVFWKPDIAAEKRWRPENSRLTRINFVDALVVGGRERIFNTRLFVKRRGLEKFVHDSIPLENDATIGDESAVWEKLWLRFEKACVDSEAGQGSNAWRYLTNPRDTSSAERWFLRDSGKSRDGFVSRYLNRPISRAVSRFLLRTSITPTAWTWMTALIPVAGFLFLIRGNYFGFVVGAALFQLFSVLDGCDGEIARAKFLESETGARLDTFFDLTGNVLFALGLGVGLQRWHPGFYSIEGVLCAAALAINEWLLSRFNAPSHTAPEIAGSAFYPRHQAMLQRSGFSSAKGGIVWWIFQLTKRDVAIFFFLLVTIAGLPQWVLHLWTVVAIGSLVLTARSRSRGR